MPSFLLELIGCVASIVAIYLICGQSRCLSAAGVLFSKTPAVGCLRY